MQLEDEDRRKKRRKEKHTGITRTAQERVKLTGEGETYEDHTSENPGHRSRLKLELGLGPTFRILELKWQKQEKQDFKANLGHTEGLSQGVKTNDCYIPYKHIKACLCV